MAKKLAGFYNIPHPIWKRREENKALEDLKKIKYLFRNRITEQGELIKSNKKDIQRQIREQEEVLGIKVLAKGKKKRRYT